jgi:hypothetical protein
MSSKFAVSVLVLGLAGASAMAFAATETKSGDIKSLDAKKHELILSSGETFEVPTTVKLNTFKVGEKVTIAYQLKNGKMEATKIEAAK